MNVKITELPLADAITGAEIVPIVQDDTTVQTTVGDLLALGVSNSSTNTLPFAMYGNNYMGSPAFGPSFDQNKFVALTSTPYPNDFLTWQFIGGSVNGVNIPTDSPLVGSSITLTQQTVMFSDYGRGLVPNQYTEFINLILEGLNLKSRIVTSNTNNIAPNPENGGLGPFWNQMNYCNADTFFLLFQETGLLVEGGGQIPMITPYGFESYNGLGGFNLWTQFTQYANLNNFNDMASALNDWYKNNNGNVAGPFVQQYNP
tara:strand:+ start:700 stop:1476 length:777 start_codon:yes stop_codon:yes gene_type:complete